MGIRVLFPHLRVADDLFHREHPQPLPGRNTDLDTVVDDWPRSQNPAYRKIILDAAPDIRIEEMGDVGTFSTTGPHFGDRYGIASELLDAFEKKDVGLLGLNCTVASVRGVVPAEQIPPALAAIQECFEVPSINKKS